jgi:hypothetical protein
MKGFDSEAFAHFDLAEDEIYPGNISPRELQKLRDFTLAKLQDDALLALRWRPKNPTSAQMRARHHFIRSRRSISSLKLNKTVNLSAEANRQFANATTDRVPE